MRAAFVNPAVVERVFARLAARYGSVWTDRFSAIDPAVLLADWCSVLEGLSADQVKFGVLNLPPNFPPDAGAFRAICLRAPEPRYVFRLPDGVTPDRPRLVALLRRMGEIARARGPRDWVADLKGRKSAGEILTPAQLEAIRRAEREDAPGMVAGEREALDRAKEQSRKAVEQYAKRVGIDLSVVNHPGAR